MQKINLKGVTAEAVTGFVLLLIALVNAGLNLFGYNTIPIGEQNVSDIISLVFLIGTSLYNLWKNRNLTQASQVAQGITDAIKNGELLVDDVKELLESIHKN